MTIRYLRLKSVRDSRGGRSRSSHYEDIADGLFTPPVQLSPDGRSVAWPSHEVAAINAAVLAGATTEQSRALVRDLIALRSAIPAGATDDEILALVRELVARTLANKPARAA